MATHTFNFSWTNGGTPVPASVAITANAENNRVFSLPLNTTDQFIDMDFAYAKLKSLFIYSDKAITIETNAVDATGGDTLSIAAGKPLIWFTGCGLANPFTHDVTAMYLTNTAVANGFIQVLFDPSA